MTNPIENAYELRIFPRRPLRMINWRDLWSYRDLLSLLVRRDFVSKYTQTVLGPIWFIAQPLITTLLFSVVFAKIGKLSTDEKPPLLFYLCGLLAWNYFSSVFNLTSTTFVANAGLFGKVYFPRILVPLSATISSMLALAIQFLLYIICYIYYNIEGTINSHPFHWQLLFLPLIVLQVGALGLGSGLWMTSLTVKYRDFTHLSGFMIGIWFYATPVIFPLSAVPPCWRALVCINPMVFAEESFRYILLGTGTVGTRDGAVCIASTLVILFSGIFAFQRYERTFVDSV